MRNIFIIFNEKLMWRWPVVAAKKNASNAAKQKIFTIHAKLISVAASNGGDPDKNPALADAIEKARKDNVPNDNISRAIKKWTWEDKTAWQIQQIIYEWYGAWWVAVIVTTLTDNKNRTASNIRHIFSKFWWSLWESWSVWFVFEKKGILIISLWEHSSQDLEEIVFETSAEDFFIEEGMFKVITSLEDFNETKKIFEGKNISFEFADIDFIPNNMMEVDDFDKALKLTKMLEAFWEDEDVERVSVNSEISIELQSEVDEFIEKNTFRT